MENCRKCGYEWKSRARNHGQRPKSCPECKRRDWDIDIIKLKSEENYEEPCGSEGNEIRKVGGDK